ncbi:hypothetical protein [Xylanibacter rodentium]|uniref:hypothetical protein n=1 Tax=Xylanibacter rodentium TaxID=2736289 RepID=UPI0025938023|nr:hypothetical protein [Xylanibacter rodentium]
MICRRRRKTAYHCLGSWTADQRRVAQRLQLRKMETALEHGVAEIARAGTAKQPAQAIRHSVFSRLLNSGNAVSGSADSSNAADGIAPYDNASLTTAKVEPSRLSQFRIE